LQKRYERGANLKASRLVGLVFIIVAVSAGLYWARSGRRADKIESASPATGGRLVVTYSSEPKNFNRLVSLLGADELISRLTQTTLIRVNRVSGDIEPRLAREWSSSADGLTWTFKLQEGVSFSDGAPFTSADVMFTFAALYDKRVASDLAATLSIQDKPLQPRAIDTHTVSITFPAVFAPGIALLDALPILPKHKLQAAPMLPGAACCSSAIADSGSATPAVLRSRTSTKSRWTSCRSRTRRCCASNRAPPI
jgi:ABC-type transport system substrate-binding protein